MLESILETLIKLILYIASFVMNLIITPILFLAGQSGIFPDLTNYLSDFSYFIDHYLVRGLAFSREVFLNVTGYPRELFHAVVLVFVGKLAFHLALVTYKY